jgi:methylated-DNA-[protein]-cysteine S-methyltransferase
MTADREMAARLNAGPGPSPAQLEALQARLLSEAGQEGLIDVAFRTIDTPVGPLLLAATPIGLARVAYQSEDFEVVLDRLADRISPRILQAPGRLDAAARQLEEYFAGHRKRFDLPLDLNLASGFRRQVLAYLPDISYGRTASYREVAAAVDHPRAVRAVGTACATNPLPLVLPCHRVIRSDGLIGAYLAGPVIKQQLLEMEEAA